MFQIFSLKRKKNFWIFCASNCSQRWFFPGIASLTYPLPLNLRVLQCWILKLREGWFFQFPSQTDYLVGQSLRVDPPVMSYILHKASLLALWELLFYWPCHKVPDLISRGKQIAYLQLKAYRNNLFILIILILIVLNSIKP